jgi:hypothetical protein
MIVINTEKTFTLELSNILISYYDLKANTVEFFLHCNWFMTEQVIDWFIWADLNMNPVFNFKIY